MGHTQGRLEKPEITHGRLLDTATQEGAPEFDTYGGGADIVVHQLGYLFLFCIRVCQHPG
jgi:hypothetical protein